MLQNRRIVLGVSGGIAAYKACDLVSRLTKRGAQVRVVLTKHACEFVPPLTFETLSGGPAYTDAFERKFEIEHIALAKWAEAMVVAPATANALAKMAAGIADDLLSTTLLAVAAPLVVAPAMNAAMWRHPATQANAALLRSRGVRFVGPGTGHLACGDDGVGRMAEPQQIVDALEALFAAPACGDAGAEAVSAAANVQEGTPDGAAGFKEAGIPASLSGKRVLVTAGPTVERIDPVRFITNRSSGKMGYAIAEAAARRGAEVVLVSGPVQLPCPAGVTRVMVESSAQLCAAVLDRAGDCDAVIQAAAPADFTPKTVAAHKIKKTGAGMALELVPTTDIARELGARKRPGQVLVAFAAETDDLVANARAKLARKNADLVVANDVTRPGAGFGADTNIVVLVTRGAARELPVMPKSQVAGAILDAVAALFEAR